MGAKSEVERSKGRTGHMSHVPVSTGTGKFRGVRSIWKIVSRHFSQEGCTFLWLPDLLRLLLLLLLPIPCRCLSQAASRARYSLFLLIGAWVRVVSSSTSIPLCLHGILYLMRHCTALNSGLFLSTGHGSFDPTPPYLSKFFRTGLPDFLMVSPPIAFCQWAFSGAWKTRYVGGGTEGGAGGYCRREGVQSIPPEKFA